MWFFLTFLSKHPNIIYDSTFYPSQFPDRPENYDESKKKKEKHISLLLLLRAPFFFLFSLSLFQFFISITNFPSRAFSERQRNVRESPSRFPCVCGGGKGNLRKKKEFSFPFPTIKSTFRSIYVINSCAY
jgi:hypothetical protein